MDTFNHALLFSQAQNAAKASDRAILERAYPVIASLMMYARPELRGPNDRYWARIRSELAQRGIEAPETLSNDRDMMEVWTAPDLVLSQTCGMPYRMWLHEKVQLIGTPDFGLQGCPNGHYRSAFIVRADDVNTMLTDYKTATFAYNQTFSHSGYAAAYAHTNASGFWFENRVQSGGHSTSSRFVAQGKADIAAIDAVTWRLIERFDNFAKDLRVLEWTAPTPGLPYIAATGTEICATREAVSAAIGGLSDEDRAALGLRGLVTITKEEYLAIEIPLSEAS